MVLYDTEVGMVASETTKPARTSLKNSSFWPVGDIHETLLGLDGGVEVASSTGVDSGLGIIAAGVGA